MGLEYIHMMPRYLCIGTYSSVIWESRARNFTMHPVDRLQYLIRQRTLLDEVKVRIQLSHIRRSNDHSMASLSLELAVMDSPSQRCGMAIDTVLLDEFDHPIDSGSDVVLQIAFCVRLAN